MWASTDWVAFFTTLSGAAELERALCFHGKFQIGLRPAQTKDEKKKLAIGERRRIQQPGRPVSAFIKQS